MNSPNYIREAKVCPVKNQLYSPNTPSCVRKQMLAQLRTGFKLVSKSESVGWSRQEIASTVQLCETSWTKMVLSLFAADCLTVHSDLVGSLKS